MNLTKYVACICEGAAEKAIMEILLDADKLIFKRDDLLEGELLRCRSGKNFEEQHLRKGFTEKITVLRILDSRREQFRLSKAYEHKIEIINVITAPEIEMLVIFNEDKYEEYKKSGKKPSDFCKTDLKYPNVKSTDFVKRYFADITSLIASIVEYRRVSNVPSGEYSMFWLSQSLHVELPIDLHVFFSQLYRNPTISVHIFLLCASLS